MLTSLAQLSSLIHLLTSSLLLLERSCAPTLCSGRVPALVRAVVAEPGEITRSLCTFPVVVTASGCLCLACLPDLRLQAAGR